MEEVCIDDIWNGSSSNMSESDWYVDSFGEMSLVYTFRVVILRECLLYYLFYVYNERVIALKFHGKLPVHDKCFT